MGKTKLKEPVRIVLPEGVFNNLMIGPDNVEYVGIHSHKMQGVDHAFVCRQSRAGDIETAAELTQQYLAECPNLGRKFLGVVPIYTMPAAGLIPPDQIDEKQRELMTERAATKARLEAAYRRMQALPLSSPAAGKGSAAAGSVGGVH